MRRLIDELNELRKACRESITLSKAQSDKYMEITGVDMCDMVFLRQHQELLPENFVCKNPTGVGGDFLIMFTGDGASSVGRNDAIYYFVEDESKFKEACRLLEEEYSNER